MQQKKKKNTQNLHGISERCLFHVSFGGPDCRGTRGPVKPYKCLKSPLISCPFTFHCPKQVTANCEVPGSGMYITSGHGEGDHGVCSTIIKSTAAAQTVAFLTNPSGKTDTWCLLPWLKRPLAKVGPSSDLRIQQLDFVSSTRMNQTFCDSARPSHMYPPRCQFIHL